MDENQKTTNLYKKLKPFIIGLLVIVVFVIGTWQMLKEQTYAVSDLGMDDIGRQVFCQTLNAAIRDIEDASIYCEGFYHDIIVISMKNPKQIVLGNWKAGTLIQFMKKPYSELLREFEGLVLRGDKMARTVDEPVPIDKINEKLTILRAKTIGDFLASCGFHKYIIRDEEWKTNWLEFTFSAKHYGSNPIEVKE